MLSECYHEDLAAEILHEMVFSLKPPGRLTPSVNEWYMIVKACQGALSTTEFPVRAEHLVFLNRSFKDNQSWVKDRRCSSVKDVAAALMGIGEVSNGVLKRVTVVGGSDAGCLAAIAEWLFDLKVAASNADGKLKYSNCGDDFPEKEIIFDTLAVEKAERLGITSRTYFLSSSSDILRRTSQSVSYSMARGRLDWKTCLTEAFPPSVGQLLTTHTSEFGLVVGYAAGILDSNCTIRTLRILALIDSITPISTMPLVLGSLKVSRTGSPKLLE